MLDELERRFGDTKTGISIFLLILAFVAGGLIALRRDAKRPLPKNLPPPLKDDEDDDA